MDFGKGTTPDTPDPRVLSEEEKEKLARDTKLVPLFWQRKYDKEAAKFWDLFYKRNENRFYKDRHWTHKEFEELVPCGKRALWEVGCGVGNMFYPLLTEDPDLYVYACDLSNRAIELIKSNDAYDESRISAFVCDVTEDIVGSHIPDGTINVATMIFVLSAIHPDKMPNVIANVFKALAPGGKVLVRDYGLYDSAMIRFAPGHKLADCFYVRQDGTRAYYFESGLLQQLFEKQGFVIRSCTYVSRETVNRKENISIPRIFVQATFAKPDI